MSRPFAGRRFAALVLSATTGAALALASGAQAAEAPILGFTPRGATAQRVYEGNYSRGVSPRVIAETSRALSRKPQLIGTPGVQQSFEYSVRRLRSYGLDVWTPSYSVYASRPRKVQVTMTAPTTQRLSNLERPFPWKEAFDDVVVGYNAYSPSGNVTGDVVYANYGLPGDYAELERLGVDVRGKIVLVRYGGSFRGVKAQQAEKHGAKGLLIYSDPEDDGYKRGAVYPDGPWRPKDGIQRGSIQYIFQYPGDPLTPDAPALPGTRRLDPGDAGNLPRIPTTPISWGDAEPLLKALGGPEAPEAFQGGLPFTYHVGPGASQANLDLDIAYQQLPVRNVLAVVRGATHPDEKVILGAHYDAWTYGTSDNTSGWTTMMEVARGLGRLLHRGWRPDRTIVIAGWDGEEYGLLGSTEWVEQFQRDLARDAVAYLNLDGAGGTSFAASGVPQVDDALIEATKAVSDPRTGKSVYDVWTAGGAAPEVGRLGSGSDYTAFLDHVGVPSVEAGFDAPASAGTYHSAYDDTFNLEHYLDPGYLGHAGSARFNGVTALRLANAQVLPFHYSDYAAAVASYVTNLQQAQSQPGAAQVDLQPLLAAANAWRQASERLEARADELLGSRRPDARAVARMNDALMRQERALTTSRGLPGRPWFRHQVYAPGLVTGYAVQYLPGMRDAVEQGDEQTAGTYRDLLIQSLQAAARLAESGAATRG
jgi:N-acetylated-alpha-linked acidic dipeptidase